MVDLVTLYRSIDPDDFDRDQATELAATIFAGAEAELPSLLAKADADEPISI